MNEISICRETIQCIQYTLNKQFKKHHPHPKFSLTCPYYNLKSIVPNPVSFLVLPEDFRIISCPLGLSMSGTLQIPDFVPCLIGPEEDHLLWVPFRDIVLSDTLTGTHTIIIFLHLACSFSLPQLYPPGSNRSVTIQAYLGDSVSSVSDHSNKMNIAIKRVAQSFWFPNAHKSYLYTIL